MTRELRVKCSCGEVRNAFPGDVCPKCKQPLQIPEDGMIYLYRKGSPFGIAGGFGIYLDGKPIGYIGNKETVRIPVNYGKHNLHIATGMNRSCNDMVIDITPDARYGYFKVWMKPGFWTNSFVLEISDPSEMPNL